MADSDSVVGGAGVDAVDEPTLAITVSDEGGAVDAGAAGEAAPAEALAEPRDERRDSIDPHSGQLTEEARAIRAAEDAPPEWAHDPAHPEHATPSVTKF